MPREKAADDIAFRILAEAKKAGAEVIVTVCPLCQLMLDAKQKSLEQKHGAEDRDSCALCDTTGGHRPRPGAGGAGAEYESPCRRWP
ncbi:MAG: heterodisulfide reductase-related iron-sulfur binding cluster [Desulfobacterales bacterium]|nr:heterodisulfide reductase-related iron-sulfur binding cluster [Desulfobacterales bacterium]